jgi:uracil-DNA glycosylase
VRLYPLFHPAAALYTRSLLETLREDFARLPGLLAIDPPGQPGEDSPPEPEPAVPEPELAAAPEEPGDEPTDAQLGLF